MKKPMTDVGIVYYLSVFAAGMIIGMTIAAALARAECLTAEQTSALRNISTFFNMSNATLISAFESECNKTNTLNTTISVLQAATTSLNSSLNATNSSIARIETIASDASAMAKGFNSTFTANLSNILTAASINAASTANESRAGFAADLLRYQDTADDRIENYKQSFITNEKFEELMKNQTGQLDSKHASWEQYVSENYSVTRMFWMWLFFGSTAIVGLITYMIKYRTETIVSFVKGVKATRRSGFEITTPSEFESKIDRVKKMKFRVAGLDVPAEEKRVLMNKIDADEIKDDVDIEEEVAILKSMRPKEVRLSQSSKKKGRQSSQR